MRLSVRPLSLRLPAGLAQRVARRARLFLRGESPGSFFDLYDLPAVNQRLVAAGLAPLAPDPREADRDVLGASRFVLALLASSLKLRASFPRALSAGPDGPFARWLLADGAKELGLSSRGAEHVREAFGYAHRVRAERPYEIRDDLRAMFPLALTPAQRGPFLDWFLARGPVEEPDVGPIGVLWCLAEHDEEPGRGLVQTCLMQPRWQERFPHGLTRFGWDGLKRWVAAEYGIRGRWLRGATCERRYGPWDELALLLQARPDLAASFPTTAALDGTAEPVLNWVRTHRLPGVDPAWEAALAADLRAGLPSQPGVNVVGLFRYPSGLQQAASVVVSALAEVGVRAELRDIPVRNTRDRRPRAGFDGLERFPVTILNAGLDLSCSDAYRDAGLYRRPGVYRVAVWWWELDRLPADWLDRGRDVDEIWAPTAFIADALRPLARPVFPMPPSVELPAFDPLPKAAFGLDPGKFAFLFVFDMNSRMARKNPLGLIRAFRRAFCPDEPVELVLKTTPQEAHWPEQWRELRSAAADARVKVIDRSLSREELLALMSAADAYVSLHRSEGFGLTMAEAMLLGKPTAATGYSGNVDFMTAENSYLIDHSLVPITAPEMAAPPGAVWAEPSVEHAAAVMRAIADRPDVARERGRRAQAELRVKLSHRAAGERMAARLRAIRGGRP
jgi:glycosyltransferase involved in cell wall biosynthesis